jgi:hypothetical protein
MQRHPYLYHPAFSIMFPAHPTKAKQHQAMAAGLCGADLKSKA